MSRRPLRRSALCPLLALLSAMGVAIPAAGAPGEAARGPVVVPAEAPRRRDPALPAPAPAPTSIYVNFDGATLQAGWDDAALDRTQIDEMVGSFAPYGDDASQRSAIMQALREDWAAYDVRITDERPAEGPYPMVMVGPTNPFGPATLGMAPLDCGDGQTTSNVAFAFYFEGDGRSAVMAATTIGHEVAHTFGLEHVDEPTAVMNAFNVGGDPSFHGECLPIEGDVVCGTQHAWSCGVEDEQSSHDELLAFFGPAVPDATPPEVGIMAPADGTIVLEGEALAIEVEADDAQGIAQVRLWGDGRLAAVDEGRPFGWQVTLADAGDHAFVVEAIDRAGNVAHSREIVVTVEPAEIEPPDALVAGEADPDAVPDPGDDDAGDDEGWEQDGAEVRCSAAPARPLTTAWMLVLLAAVRRRRRP
jgi:hypothetical protein